MRARLKKRGKSKKKKLGHGSYSLKAKNLNHTSGIFKEESNTKLFVFPENEVIEIWDHIFKVSEIDKPLVSYKYGTLILRR